MLQAVVRFIEVLLKNGISFGTILHNRFIVDFLSSSCEHTNSDFDNSYMDITLYLFGKSAAKQWIKANRNST